MPWADQYARVTYRYEYLMLRYCQMMTQKAAAGLLPISASTLSDQLHLVKQGISSGRLNATITGLKFFFEIILEHPEAMSKMSHVYEPWKIPLILSLKEVTRLLQEAGGPKYQAALGTAYGAGLRANEVVRLTVNDIDSERMVIHVEQGKGKRDRYAMLSPTLLELLRTWWRHGYAQQKTVARLLVVSGAESRQPDVALAAQPCLPVGTQGGWDRQGSVAAFAPCLRHTRA